MSKCARRWLVAATVAILLLLPSLWAWHWVSQALWTPYQGYLEDSRNVVVPVGASARTAAELLASAGVIPDAEVFFNYLRGKRWTGRLKAGTYRFDRPMTAPEIAAMLISGSVARVEVTIPEGWTASRVFHHLEELGIGHFNRYMELWKDPSPIRDIVPEASTLEGFLFPDTYSFEPSMSEKEIVSIMLKRFRSVALPVLENGRPPRSLSRIQILALASMVEKETGVPEERGLVSSVMYNRMSKGMKMQCDPTVIYAEWLEKKDWDGLIHQSDLKRPSPYNTYWAEGLPPGPICSPGLASLRAALAPAGSNYLYFVAMNNGRHVFNSELAAHEAAVKKYQR